MAFSNFLFKDKTRGPQNDLRSLTKDRKSLCFILLKYGQKGKTLGSQFEPFKSRKI